ncbi:MAG: galactitol-1-phosphate 5-dehydrogenase [Eubacterium sp.]|nr:galactitol-1-phosphate 5-dehydrogenase [Eubacterium sp.]
MNDIRYEEADVPSTDSNEVLVRVHAAGICGSDVPRVYETGAHRMPLIPGHEFSGEVEGKRVAVYPLIPCKKCPSCLQDQYELCRDYDYIGSRRDGAFAEYVRVPADNIIEIPDSVSYEAAAMMEPMAVAVHAMRIGLRGLGVPEGDYKSLTKEYTKSEQIGGQVDSKRNDLSIAICGLGTIGLSLVMFLLEAGYQNLYLIGNKDIQIDTALSLAEEYQYDQRLSSDCKPAIKICDTRNEDPVSWINDQCLGFALYFDCVGSVESLDYGLKGLLPGGRLITVGNPHGDMNLPRDSYWQILRKQLTILGTWNSSFFPGRYHGKNGSIHPDSWLPTRDKPDDWHYVLDRLARGRVKPEKLITHRLKPDELEKGLVMMRDKTEEYIKVMMCGRKEMIYGTKYPTGVFS